MSIAAFDAMILAQGRALPYRLSGEDEFTVIGQVKDAAGVGMPALGNVVTSIEFDKLVICRDDEFAAHYVEPAKPDRIMIDGREYVVQSTYPLYWLGTLIGWRLLVLG